jgi:hypothetical protein
VPVNRPKQGSHGLWQKSSLQPLAARLNFLTLREFRKEYPAGAYLDAANLLDYVEANQAAEAFSLARGHAHPHVLYCCVKL